MREVIARYPTTGAIFVQLGRMFRAVPGSLYASYDPALGVGDFATQNGLDLRRLLDTLNAAVEAETFAAQTPKDARRREEGREPVPYTETLYGRGRVVGPAD